MIERLFISVIYITKRAASIQARIHPIETFTSHFGKDN